MNNDLNMTNDVFKCECKSTDIARDNEKHTPYFDMIDEEKLEPSPSREHCGEYEMVDHPTHYNNYPIEVIDMMVGIWGKENVALWCDITAFKYRMRMGTKPENSIEQDLEKEAWYLNKAKELRQGFVIDGVGGKLFKKN